MYGIRLCVHLNRRNRKCHFRERKLLALQPGQRAKLVKGWSIKKSDGWGEGVEKLQFEGFFLSFDLAWFFFILLTPPPPPSLFLWSVSKPSSHWPLKQERRRKRFYVLVLINETMIETQTNDRQKQSMERTEYSFFSPPLLHPLCFHHLCRSVNRHDGGGEKDKKMNHKNLPQSFKEV